LWDDLSDKLGMLVVFDHVFYHIEVQYLKQATQSLLSALAHSTIHFVTVHDSSIINMNTGHLRIVIKTFKSMKELNPMITRRMWEYLVC